MVVGSLGKNAFAVLGALVFSMLLFSCAGNREYTHYRWKGKSTQKHTAKAEAPVKLPQTSEKEKHSPSKESAVVNTASLEAEAGTQVQKASTSKATQKRQVAFVPKRSFPGLQSLRFVNPMEVLVQNLIEDHISALEENQIAEDSLLWWGLLLAGVGIILLLLAGILGAGNGFALAWLFWAVGSVSLAAGLILLLVYLLKMI